MASLLGISHGERLRFLIGRTGGSEAGLSVIMPIEQGDVQRSRLCLELNLSRIFRMYSSFYGVCTAYLIAERSQFQANTSIVYPFHHVGSNIYSIHHMNSACTSGLTSPLCSLSVNISENGLMCHLLTNLLASFSS